MNAGQAGARPSAGWYGRSFVRRCVHAAPGVMTSWLERFAAEGRHTSGPRKWQTAQQNVNSPHSSLYRSSTRELQEGLHQLLI